MPFYFINLWLIPDRQSLGTLQIQYYSYYTLKYVVDNTLLVLHCHTLSTNAPLLSPSSPSPLLIYEGSICTPLQPPPQLPPPPPPPGIYLSGHAVRVDCRSAPSFLPGAAARAPWRRHVDIYRPALAAAVSPPPPPSGPQSTASMMPSCLIS